MNNYAVYAGIFNELRKTFNVPSKPEQFESRLKPFLEELGVDNRFIYNIYSENFSTRAFCYFYSIFKHI